MPDLKLDASHDLALVDGDFLITRTEDESLAQRLIIKLRTWRGEWFLDQTVGTPWYQSILGKPRSKETIDAILKNIILEEPEVIQIQSFESSIDNQFRIYTLNFTVLSENSTEAIPVELSL